MDREGERYFTKMLPLWDAIHEDDCDAVEELLANDSTLIYERLNKHGQTVLHLAAGNYRMVAKILNMIEDETHLEIKDSISGSTPLHYAARQGHLQVAKLMVKKNRNLPKIKDDKGISPLHIAVWKENSAMSQYFYPLSDFHLWTGEEQISLLTSCISNGLSRNGLYHEDNWDAVQDLLAKDSTLIDDHIKNRGQTALHIAAGNYRMVTNLLDMIEDETRLEKDSIMGSTPLHYAASRGLLQIAKLMVKRNRKLPKIRDNKGNSPLHIAVSKEYSAVAEYLYPLTDFHLWTEKDQISLLTSCISNGWYRLALTISEQYKLLAVVRDDKGNTPSGTLDLKRSRCSCPSPRSFWITILETMLPCVVLKTNHDMDGPCDACELLHSLNDSYVFHEEIKMELGIANNTSKAT